MVFVEVEPFGLGLCNCYLYRWSVTLIGGHCARRKFIVGIVKLSSKPSSISTTEF
jgi:hypothetical protein